ncbi:PREDICTED: germin-like protein subfamily 1 member 20 isoform X4 [Ipomoea nil]|uniref:germin-like protein subfamily 1 member 20 isoform X4 n=1 Tax=Ipomoea nil TaxID=35883 RepID=UPI0009010E99|nr:PREDICTED: germin-like protein subfamily 1 member 20 isoform X4 [Ipomoea nil]
MASLPIMKSLLLLGLVASFGRAYEPSPMQDFCVAVPDAKAAVFVNGKVCKNPKLVEANDFYMASGFNTPAGGTNISSVGLITKLLDVNQFPGLNTMGLSIARMDFARNGLIPPHTHSRGSEVVFVMEGTLYVGFVTSNPLNGEKNKFFTKILNSGDSFIFPVGLVHFLYNVGRTNAVVFAAFNSQNPGHVTLANSAFGSAPPISQDILTKAFRLDQKLINYLQSQTWPLI